MGRSGWSRVLIAAWMLVAPSAFAAGTLNIVPNDPLVLDPHDRDISEQNLNFSTHRLEQSWAGLAANPAKGSFDAYFEIFMGLARIESIGRAAEIAKLKGESKIGVIASHLADGLKKKGVTADAAGLKALQALLSEPDATAFGADPDALQVRYTLILDYLTDEHAAGTAIDLADKLTRSGHKKFALAILRDFVSNYINTQPTIAQKLQLGARVGRSAALIDDPMVVSVLTDIIRRTPIRLRADLTGAVIKALPSSFENVLSASPFDDAEKDLQDAWKTDIALAHGRVPERAVDGLLRSSGRRLDSRAFDILVSGTTSEADRNRMIAAAVADNLAISRPIEAYRKVRSLDFDLRSDPALYVRLMGAMADAGYGTYVDDMAKTLSAELKKGGISLHADTRDQLFVALEAAMDVVLVREIAALIPDSTAAGEKAILRGRIETAFDGPVNKPIGSLRISADAKGMPQALVDAALLINGESPADTLPQAATPSSSADTALLTESVGKLWRYGGRQGLIVRYLTSAAPHDLKLAVALGVTANPAFETASDDGKAAAASIIALISKAKADDRIALLQASLGLPVSHEPASGTAEWQELAARKAHFAAAAGAPASADATSNTATLVSQAIFGNFHEATESLKKIADYRTRLLAFRDVAESKAMLLDTKTWLNSAIPQPGRDSTALNAKASVDESDGHMALRDQTDGMPTAARQPFMPNLLISDRAITNRIPVEVLTDKSSALAGISKRGETRATRLMRFSSEHFDDVINLGVREYLFLKEKTSTPRIMFVTRGVMTIGELLSEIALTDPDAITEDNGIVTLNVPLAINEGAELIISGKEIKELRFSTDNGAFLVNSGKLYIDGVTVSSYSEKTHGPTFVRDPKQGFYFRPFILSWSGSETYASNSHFVALGYSGGRTYGMSLSSGSTDTAFSRFKVEPPTGYFINNSFENLYYGFYAFEAKDIVFVGNELFDGVIYGLDPHDRSINLMMAYNTAYGSLKKHGIIISREVDDSFIVGNLSFDNHGTGIMLDRQSYGTIVYGNVASENHGDGFSAMESPCALVDSNLFSGNLRSGVKVRNSWDIHVENNVIVGNKVAGVEAYIDNLQSAALSEFRNFKKDPFYPIATISVQNNVLQKNRTGVLSHGAAEAVFFQNRFIDQLPRYLGGDYKKLALQTVGRSMDRPVSLRSACLPRIPVKKTCSLIENGIIPSQTGDPAFSSPQADAGYCVGDNTTTQAAAFHNTIGE